MALLYIPPAAKACLQAEGGAGFCRLVVCEHPTIRLMVQHAWLTDEEADRYHYYYLARTAAAR